MNRLYFIILLATFCSCEELIEVEDISNETVSVLAPANNSILESTMVNFTWQPIDRAESYQLQVALPNFDNAQTIVEDTIISTTNYTKTLESGNYQWRIKAINFAYETLFTTQNLTIEE